MDVEEAGPTEDVFYLRAPVLRAQHPEQFNLAVGACGVIRVASFGRHGPEAPVQAMQVRLSEPGTRCDHYGVALGMRSSPLQDDRFFRGERFLAAGHCLEVV